MIAAIQNGVRKSAGSMDLQMYPPIALENQIRLAITLAIYAAPFIGMICVAIYLAWASFKK